MSSEKILISCPAGKLEVQIDLPASVDFNNVLIVSHPHPLHGGSMTNKVVHTIARAANLSGMAAVRYNFRGVGQSEGEFDHGIGEQEDLQMVIDYARNQFSGHDLALAGFSFGAAISMAKANSKDIKFLITVAPPLYEFTKDIDVVKPRWGLFMAEDDEVVDPALVKSWLAGQKVKPQEYWFDSAGHFFHGKLAGLRGRLVEFIRNQA